MIFCFGLCCGFRLSIDSSSPTLAPSSKKSCNLERNDDGDAMEPIDSENITEPMSSAPRTTSEQFRCVNFADFLEVEARREGKWDEEVDCDWSLDSLRSLIDPSSRPSFGNEADTMISGSPEGNPPTPQNVERNILEYRTVCTLWYPPVRWKCDVLPFF